MYEVEKVIEAISGMTKLEWLYLRKAIDQTFEEKEKSNSLDAANIERIANLESDPVVRMKFSN